MSRRKAQLQKAFIMIQHHLKKIPQKTQSNNSCLSKANIAFIRPRETLRAE